MIIVAFIGAIPATIAAIAAWHGAVGTSRGNRTLGDVKEAVNGSATRAAGEIQTLREEIALQKAEIARLQALLPTGRRRRT